MSTEQSKVSITISLYKDTVYELETAIEQAAKSSYHSITTPIVHRRFQREFVDEPLKAKHNCFTRSDLLLSSSQWLNRVICKLSSNVDCDSLDENVRKQGEATIEQEKSFAEHLVQNGYMLVRLKNGNCANLARVLAFGLKGVLLVEVPMSNPKITQATWRSDVDEKQPPEDTWKWWNNFRSYADFDSHIKIALEFTADIPKRKEIYRWLGEPVDAIVISSNIFLTNSKNYPVLSKAHQELLVLFHRILGCHFILKANPEDPRLVAYADYLKFVIRNNYTKDPMQGYDDLLEIPLQPLYDNLDSFTYEVFEKDPVKYILYQNAIEEALRDRVPTEEIETRTSVIMVVGGGRGPLVRAALNASLKCKRKVKIYVIEKNPNAIVTLSALINELWKDRNVELISTDMREFKPPEKADILVSELLGSFGDNELSPECLDGAQKQLKPDGISIPCKSTSYLNPCMTTKIYNQIRALEKSPHSKDRVVTSRHMEGSYVAYLKNVYHIDDPQVVFEFVHPNRENVFDNSRFKTLRFKATLDCVMHGFVGYFDTVLYKDITISIHPYTHTKGLASWFSIFFPLSEPMQIKKGDDIVVNFWRCVASHKVWYEWNVAAPRQCHIHNVRGRGQPIWK
ncbi:protein arginine N-methyltransferase 5 [Toxorhynchites rutilus septentrionalis]|uniref:protein arginine N-methyltransferase 5 n=1 Tax=Toxorhynchites rutilus septentrionalis TaxID=329112 RepID=UPI0024783747|nr:protein arginine N-methyltransferase 5 [Toxorhynchites rutilus septentrionalis]